MLNLHVTYCQRFPKGKERYCVQGTSAEDSLHHLTQLSLDLICGCKTTELTWLAGVPV